MYSTIIIFTNSYKAAVDRVKRQHREWYGWERKHETRRE